jgi:hypothetical protein
MCRIFCGGFFEIAGSVVVVSYVKDGTSEFCCVVFAVMGHLRLVWVLRRGGGI